MKKFTVDPAVFAKWPDYCLGVVVVEGFDNAAPSPAIDAMLDQSAADFAARHAGDNVRELPGVKACREAFQALSMNPNKFMVSIEALAKRVQKNGALPHINLNRFAAIWVGRCRTNCQPNHKSHRYQKDRNQKVCRLS